MLQTSKNNTSKSVSNFKKEGQLRIAARRLEILESIKEAEADYKAGNLITGTVDDLFATLNED